jgi:bifunctional DNA-binding transcriptional regulator/antitoxin component of YhaV-PrlF toxin-antitoxin module
VLSGTFITKIEENDTIKIPTELSKRLKLQKNDRVEVLVKHIKKSRFNIKISQNPLGKLLDTEEGVEK